MQLKQHDALLVVDMQRDFLPGGALPVPGGEAIIIPLNQYIQLFILKGLPIFFTRDWHPPEHCSFMEQGGPWPRHCVAGTSGTEFAEGLLVPNESFIISKAKRQDKEAYSAFACTDLATILRRQGIKRLFIGGLATDYCVLNTVLDALAAGLQVVLLEDAISAVNVHPGDEERALQRIREAGSGNVIASTSAASFRNGSDMLTG